MNQIISQQIVYNISMSNNSQTLIHLIKIKLSLDSISPSKYLIDIIPDFHLKVIDFLTRTVQLLSLDLDPQLLHISINGFILPHQMNTRCLNQNQVYEISFNGNKSQLLKKKSSKPEFIQKKQIKRTIKKAKSVSNSSSSSSSSLSSSSSSSSSDSSLLEITNKKQRMNKKRETKRKQTDERKILEVEKKIALKKPETLPKQPNPTIQANKPTQKKKGISIKNRKVSSESSLSSESQIHLPVPKPNQSQISPQSTKLKKVPISVRAKQPIKKIEDIGQKKVYKQFRSFSEYKQSRWIPVTKQKLNRWNEENKSECILSKNNKIRFKVIQLDMEKFVPVTSGWIEAYVGELAKGDDDWSIQLVNVFKEGLSDYEKMMQIGIVNMQQLQIYIDNLDDKQKGVLLSENQEKGPENKKQEVPQEKKEQEKNPQSLQDFICGQIHYYFSHKNYQKDLFMQMHANNHPHKYINLRVMLNFGKIKKVLRDEGKLLEYLKEDPKYQQRNYEVDFDNRMIRCKNYKDYHINNPPKDSGDQEQNQQN